MILKELESEIQSLEEEFDDLVVNLIDILHANINESPIVMRDELERCVEEYFSFELTQAEIDDTVRLVMAWWFETQSPRDFYCSLHGTSPVVS